MTGAATAYIGQSLRRREDRRLLTGQGQFVADLVLPGMLHAVIVRSPHAHARIRGVDLAAARAAPGVVMALSGPELLRQIPPIPDAQISVPRKWTSRVQHSFLNPQQPILAYDKARHVGEALAVIVAESREAAEDAAEKVGLDLETLPAVTDPEAGLAVGAPIVHERFGTNLIGSFSIGKGDAAAALAAAPHRLQRRFYHHRYAAMPLECRGVVAAYDRRGDAVTIWSATQVPHWVRREAARILGLSEARVRAVALDVGGGFGGKGQVYPEDLLMPFLARATGRPVRWIEERREHLLSATHSRDQIHDFEIGFDNDGHILAVRDDYLVDCGAWNPIGSGVAYNTAAHLLGPYKVDHYAASGRVAVTTKTPNAAYRGAGRPEAVFAMERGIDLVAAALGLEPAEVRRRNMIGAAEMPYEVGIPYRDGEPIVYDSGDFPRGLQLALDAVGGLDAFRQRQQQARRDGRRLGLGIGCYVEGTGVGPYESALVRVDPSGKIVVGAGASPQGQGMETVYAQIAADIWKVNPEDIVVILGDTAAIATGVGTFASRSTVTVSAAVHEASARLQKKVLAIAANLLECAVADVELRDGGVGVVGVPEAAVSLARIAAAARPGWDHGRPADIEAGLEETYHWEPPTVTWSSATHVAIVAVDPETGHVALEDYAVAHDCGTVVNPLLVEGQIAGGATQGIGGILCEAIRYDNEGQLLSGSLMDYAVPTAGDVPSFKTAHLHSPSPLNPLGVKGVGEGGAVAPPAAIANAVCDALKAFGVEFNQTPITAERVLAALRNARAV